MAPHGKPKYGLGYAKEKAPLVSRAPKVYSAGELCATVSLVMREEGHRFDIECAGKLCPSYRSFHKLYRYGQPIYAVFVSRPCVFRFRLDKLGVGKIALRALRRLVGAQFYRRSQLKDGKLQPTKKLKRVKFVRETDPPPLLGVKSGKKKKNAGRSSLPFWGSEPDPRDMRLVGTKLELPAYKKLRAVAIPFSDKPLHDHDIPGWRLSQVMSKIVDSDDQGILVRPNRVATDRYNQTDFVLRSAVSHAERGGRFVAKFDNSALLPYFSDHAPGEEVTQASVDAYAERWARENAVTEDTPLRQLMRNVRGEGSKREVANFESSGLAGFF